MTKPGNEQYTVDMVSGYDGNSCECAICIEAHVPGGTLLQQCGGHLENTDSLRSEQACVYHVPLHNQM